MAKLKVKYLALFNQLKTKCLSIDLVEKVDYDAKISEIENKHFTTSYYNRFTSNTLDAKISQKNS